MRIASEKGWEAAQFKGSRSIIIWESTDLVHWSKERSFDIDLPDAGCVWAPETIYDEETQEHLIFWASMVKGERSAPKQIIYSSRTKDFKQFSDPAIYIERENHVIDTTIIKADNCYYRFSKDETTKCIIVEQSRDLSRHNFINVESSDLNNIFGVEGPALFKFNDRNEWCLLVDQFATNKGYLPLITDDLSTGKFRKLNEDEYFLGDTKKRHGSILNLTRSEYESLLSAWAPSNE